MRIGDLRAHSKHTHTYVHGDTPCRHTTTMTMHRLLCIDDYWSWTVFHFTFCQMEFWIALGLACILATASRHSSGAATRSRKRHYLRSSMQILTFRLHYVKLGKIWWLGSARLGLPLLCRLSGLCVAMDEPRRGRHVVKTALSATQMKRTTSDVWRVSVLCTLIARAR